jgi:hypothetical protein
MYIGMMMMTKKTERKTEGAATITLQIEFSLLRMMTATPSDDRASTCQGSKKLKVK